MRNKDYTGRTIGYLYVVCKSDKKSKSGNAYYHCACVCGASCLVHSGNLSSESVLSCGCWRVKSTGDTRRTHGKTGTRLYKTWRHIVSRCHYEKDVGYKNYGGRGVTVCDEWRNDSQKFMSWAESNGYSDSLTIERKNPFLGYSPDNCTFIPRSEQNKNKRCHHAPPPDTGKI